MRRLVIFLALASCSDESTASTAYIFEAAEGVGIEPDNRIIVPNAKAGLTEVLGRCGVITFREVEISDGLIGFRFELRKGEQAHKLGCIRNAMPRGARVEETIVP